MQIKDKTKAQKIRITIENDIDAGIALQHVAEVVSKGRCSKNGTMYCLATLFSDNINVYATEYRKNDCFLVCKETKQREF